jgi:Fe-S-cluster containining protein
MKQILPEKICLSCHGCCRFADAETIWLPCLLEKEVKSLSKKLATGIISCDKKILPVASKEKDVFFCPFLNQEDNKCKVYADRPFECRLYPFLINRAAGKIYLAVDTNCPFAQENFSAKSFKDHAAYLARLLNTAKFRKLLKDNPQLIQSYPEVVNVVEIKV